MEIGLHISALGLVLLGDQVPTLLGGGAVGKTHFGGVGKPLRKEVTGNGVLKFPLDNLGGLFWSRLDRIDGVRIWAKSGEVCPSMCHLHGITEAHLEDGPVGAIWLEAWNIGQEFFDGGGSGGGQW